MAREIVKEDGLGRNGLLGKGVTGTMARNGYFNMVKNSLWESTDAITGVFWILPHGEELGADEPRLQA